MSAVTDWRRAMLEWFTDNPPPDSPADTTGIAAYIQVEVGYITPPRDEDDGNGVWLHTTSAGLDGGCLPFFIREGMLACALRDVQGVSSEREDD